MNKGWLQRKTGLKSKSDDPWKKAVAKLDTAVSLMVRARDEGKPCVTCGAVGRQMDCGHFQWREQMATRFHLKNLAGQCTKCNRFQGGRTYEFGLELDKRWGAGTADEMYKLAHTTKKWDIKHLEQLTSAAKKGVRVYSQLYRELDKNL